MNDEVFDIEDDIYEDNPQKLIDETITKIQDILKYEFPDYLSFGNSSFTITSGSTQVMVTVRPFTNKDTIVECVSHVVKGANIDSELMKFLLRKNSELHFGAFGLLFDGTVTFSHAITGSNMDNQEFVASLKTVAMISDHYDDIIVKKAGGMRASDNFDTDLDNLKADLIS
jgi:hypothetical protein